ncbi:unnamed protein product [Caenorhabditis angaria]|uniref:Uncharacterized protein n=1 Tax=Caenorhabditis angaria TaxID=860376 RepID=A0A9P1I5V9_9PELO|nr:unnamed protein product [Caenorhabditis angaria]
MVKQKNQKKGDVEKTSTSNNTMTTTTVTTTANTGSTNTGGGSNTANSAYSTTTTTNRNNTTVVNIQTRPQTQQQLQQKRDREKSSSSNQGSNYRKQNDNRGSRDYNKERNNSNYLSTNGKNKNHRDNSSHSRKGGNSNYYSSNSSLANSVTGVVNQQQQEKNVETKKSEEPLKSDNGKKNAWDLNKPHEPEKENTEAVEKEPVSTESGMPHSFFSPTTKFRDTVLSYIEFGKWDRVELICELINILDPFDLRLVYTLIESSQKTYSATLRPMEKRANSMDPMFCFPAPDEMYHEYYQDGHYVVKSRPPSPSESAASVSSKDSNEKKTDANKVPEKPKENKKLTPAEIKNPPVEFVKPSYLAESLYILVSLLEPTNRKSAFKISLYIETYCITWREHHLSKVCDINDKLEVLETMGKVVSACLYHPAFSVTDKLKYAQARDQIRAEYDELAARAEREANCPGYADKNCKFTSERGVGEKEEEEDEGADLGTSHVHKLGSTSNLTSTTKSSPGTFVYIQQFVGKYLASNDQFHIEIHWSDGDKTYTSRTREQLKILQHRLLDEFGNQQRLDNQQMTASMSSEEEKTISNSDLITSNGRRILPRLNPEGSVAEIVQYINELSDMPARMMLSRAICEEFNSTRNKTNELQNDSESDSVSLSRWRPPSSIPSFPRLTTPLNASSNYSVTFPPMKYGSVPENQFQVFHTTCSTCSGPHSYLFCEDMPILDRKKYLEDKTTQGSRNGTTANTTHYHPQPLQNQLPYGNYQNPMNDGAHFAHHQSIFMQHQRYGGGPMVVQQLYDPNYAYYQQQQQQQQSQNVSFTNTNV